MFSLRLSHIVLLLIVLLAVCQGKSLSNHKRDGGEEERLAKRSASMDYTNEEDAKSRKKRTTTDPLNYELVITQKDATPFKTSKLFVSIGLATTIFHRVSYNSFAVEGNRKFFNLAEALSPAVVRVGGAGSGFLIFKPDGVRFPVTTANQEVFKREFGEDFWTGSVGSGYTHFNVTSYEWERVHRFFVDVGWKLNFNLNSFLWDYNNGVDFKNIELLLKFCNETDLPFYGFQFFNEPNSYTAKYGGYTRNGTLLTEDWSRLEAVQNQSQWSYFKDTLRIGPDVTSISRHESAHKYLQSFFEAGGWRHQDVLGLHHYFFSGPSATTNDFMDPDYFDTLGETVRRGRALCDQYKPEMPVHLSEVSDGFGGGSDPLSYAFVSIFIFMDTLGQAALYGAEVVNKYTYFSGAYGLMGSYSEPHPNYWIALAHKQLIEGPVLKANITGQEDRLFRTYAHCIREDFKYNGQTAKIGGVVIAYINMHDVNVTLTMPWPNKDVHKYIFTGDPDLSDEPMLKSSTVYMNARKMEMNSDCVPTLYGDIVATPTTINVPRYSAGFLVYPATTASDCVNNR